ncbi:ABC transporter [Chromatiales bacterium (ex Bugula neritina AB1)]|nr:ABC transporter [Chromatiales bacterium (ex Bugula neritina AB1)]
MKPLLELRGVSKIFPTVVANDAVDLFINEGEIHAILGENGAGKSTLMKMIYGVSQPDAGEIIWRGKKVTVRSPAHARSLRIGMVFQHFSLFESLTVAENISLAVKGSLPDLSRRIEEAGKNFGLPVAPDTLVHSLSVGERQRVEIIRCILQSPQLLIMDEPTSVLPPQGVEQLFNTLRKLKSEGCSILYISHKLDEIRSLCDKATILRDGKVVNTAIPSQESAQSLAHMMIGRDIPHATHADPDSGGKTLLQIENLAYTPADPFATTLIDTSLHVNAGEIVGIAGVSGNGQNELMRLISGEDLVPANQGKITIDGETVNRLDPIRRRRLGLAFVPEERLGRGAVPELSLGQNSLLTGLETGLARWGLIRFGPVKQRATECISDNDVRCGGPMAIAGSLSGGNLQKFIVGREMALAPKLLVLSQPTWGVDVGAASAIRQALINLRDQGTAILVVSEELEELFEVTDRLHTIYQGQLSPAVKTRETTVTHIGEWMTGQFLTVTSSEHSTNRQAGC